MDESTIERILVLKGLSAGKRNECNVYRTLKGYTVFIKSPDFYYPVTIPDEGLIKAKTSKDAEKAVLKEIGDYLKNNENRIFADLFRISVLAGLANPNEVVKENLDCIKKAVNT